MTQALINRSIPVASQGIGASLAVFFLDACAGSTANKAYKAPSMETIDERPNAKRYLIVKNNIAYKRDTLPCGKKTAPEIQCISGYNTLN